MGIADHILPVGNWLSPPIDSLTLQISPLKTQTHPKMEDFQLKY